MKSISTWHLWKCPIFARISKPSARQIALGVSVTTLLYVVIKSLEFKVRSVTPSIKWFPRVCAIQRRAPGSRKCQLESVSMASDENQNTDAKIGDEPAVTLQVLPDSDRLDSSLHKEESSESEKVTDDVISPSEDQGTGKAPSPTGVSDEDTGPSDSGPYDPSKIDELLKFVQDCEESGDYGDGDDVKDGERDGPGTGGNVAESDNLNSAPLEFMVTYGGSGDGEPQYSMRSYEIGRRCGYEEAHDSDADTDDAAATDQVERGGSDGEEDAGNLEKSPKRLAGTDEQAGSLDGCNEGSHSSVEAACNPEDQNGHGKVQGYERQTKDDSGFVTMETAQGCEECLEGNPSVEESPMVGSGESGEGAQSNGEDMESLREDESEKVEGLTVHHSNTPSGDEQQNGTAEDLASGDQSPTDESYPQHAALQQTQSPNVNETVTRSDDVRETTTQATGDDMGHEISADEDGPDDLIVLSSEEPDFEVQDAEMATTPVEENQEPVYDTSQDEDRIVELHPHPVTTHYYDEEPEIAGRPDSRMNLSLSSFLSVDSDDLDAAGSTGSVGELHSPLRTIQAFDSISELDDDEDGVFHQEHRDGDSAEQSESGAFAETERTATREMEPASVEMEDKKSDGGGYTIEEARLVTLPEEHIEYHTVLTFTTGFHVLDKKVRKERRSRRSTCKDREECEMVATGVYKPYDLFRIIRHYLEKWFETDDTKVYIVTPTIDCIMLTELMECMLKTNYEDPSTEGGALERLCTRDIGPATVKLSQRMKNLYHQKIKPCVWTSKVGISAFNCKFFAGEYPSGKVELLITSANFTTAHLNKEKRHVYNDRQRDTLVLLKTTPQYFHDKYLEPLDPVLRKLV